MALRKGLKMANNSQEKAVLERLMDVGHLSSIEAIQEMGITRLSSVIFKLRNKGHIIETYNFTSVKKNRYGNNQRIGIYFYKGYEQPI